MRGGSRIWLKKSLFVVAAGFLISPLIPVITIDSTTQTKTLGVATQRAQAITRDEQTSFLKNYKTGLKQIGAYVNSPKIADRTDTSEPITISIPPDVAGQPNLELTLNKFQTMALPKKDAQGEYADISEYYVTDLFMFFEVTSPADKNLTLVMEYGGIGAIFPTDTEDASDISKAVYGDPSKCRIQTDANDPWSLEFSPTGCDVSIAAIANQTEREAMWYNFADRVIPEELQPTSCSVSSSTKSKTISIATAALGVGRAKAISIGDIASGIADVATSVGNTVVDVATSASEAVMGAAGNVINTCNKTLDIADDLLSNTVVGRVWGWSSPMAGLTKFGVKVARFSAGTATNTLRAVAPKVAQTMGVKKASGGIDVEKLKESCAWKVISSALYLDIAGAITEVIKCFIGQFINVIEEKVKEYLDSVVNLSLIPEKPRLIGGNFFIGTAHATFSNDLREPNNALVKVWTLSMELVNVFVILALLLMAFSNIFHININTYGIKKNLPNLIIGVLGANASLFIIRFLVDLCSVLAGWAAEIAGYSNVVTMILGGFFQALWNWFMTSGALMVLTLPILLLIALPLSIYLFFLEISFLWIFFKRVVLLYVLSMIAPLAFVAYGLPPFQKYFYQWWEYFLRYLFMWPAVMFGVALFLIVSTELAAGRTMIPGTGTIVSTVFMFVLATFILKIPKFMSKGAMDAAATFKKMIGFLPSAVAGAHTIAGKKASYYKSKAATDPTFQPKADKWKKMSGHLGSARAYSYIMANPDKTAQSWWNARTEDVEKTSNTESSKLDMPEWLQTRINKRRGAPEGSKINISDVVSGKSGGYSSKVEIARKLAGDLSTTEGVESFLNEAPSQKLYEALKNYENTKFKDDTGNITDAEGLASFRAKVIEAKKWDKMNKLIQEITEDPDAINNMNPEDLEQLKNGTLFGYAKLSAGYEQKLKVIRQQRGGKKIRNLAYEWDGQDAPPDNNGGYGGTYAEPTTPPSSGPSAGEPVHVVIDDYEERAKQIVYHGSALRDDAGSMGDKFFEHLQNWEEVNSSGSPETFRDAADRLADSTRETLLGALDSTKENYGAIAQEIKDASHEDLYKLLENFSLASSAPGNAEEIRRQVMGAAAGSRYIEEQNRQMAGAIDETKLASLINGSVEDLAKQLNADLGGHLKNLSEAMDNKDLLLQQNAIFTRMASELKQSLVGRGPLSIKTALSSLGTTMAKSAGIRQLAPAPVASKIADAQHSEPTPPTPPSQSTPPPASTPEPPQTPPSTT